MGKKGPLSIVAMYEAQLTQKPLSIQAAFWFSSQHRELQSLYGEIFHLNAKFLINISIKYNTLNKLYIPNYDRIVYGI